MRRGSRLDEVAALVRILPVQLDAALLEFGPVLDVYHGGDLCSQCDIDVMGA